MRILEVRDGFIKLESAEKIALSSFLQIDGFDKQYIAQVIQVKRAGENVIAYAKILFLYDGTLKNYDKSLPDKNAKISSFTFDILSNSIFAKNPVIAGRFVCENIDIPIDKECFNKKTLICTDKPQTNNLILSNLAKQFEGYGRVIIIDMLGVVEGSKYTAGVDFSLPLNIEGLSFMYEDCLNDTTSESKAMIKEIFLELGEYAKTVPFLPFSALKTVVDDLVDKSHVFKLLVLKNKLAKFDKDGCFAKTKTDAENLNRILESKFAIIDLSKLDMIFQNRYLSSILSILSKQKEPVQIFVESSNLINKKNIKTLVTNPDISAAFITHSRFKYINEIKNLFDNFIIEPSFNANEVFKIYNTFLNSMPKDTYLLVGEGTNYIPLVSKLEIIDTVVKTEQNQTETETQNSENELSVEDLENEITDETIKEENLIYPSEAEELEPAAKAIEKKSDDLIEKLSEEVSTAPANINLFEDEETEDKTLQEEDLNPLEVEQINEANLEEPVNRQESIEEIHSEDIPEETLIQEEDSSTEDLSPELQEETGPEEIPEVIDTDSQISESGLPVQENEEPPVIEEEPAEEITLPEEISDFTGETITENEPVQEIPALKEFEDNNNELGVIPLNDDNSELDELVELDADSAADEDTILVDLGDDEENLSDEDLDKQIVEDVDKVFTTMKEDDEISDSDLDFIDELNEENNSDELEELTPSNGLEELQPLEEDNDDEGFLEPLEEVGSSQIPEENSEILETKNSTTPIVPVYDADIPPEDMVTSDPIEQGDTVTHAKYGTGVVEKMIKYGTKTLYSINFDNIGRRLLDPTLTEIKKS